MRHVFLRSLCPWACFPKLSNSQLILSCTSRGSSPWFWQLQGILIQSLFGLLWSSSHKGWAKLPLLFLHSLKLKTYPFMSLDFLLPILNEHWLTDWAFLVFEGPLILDFNTCNILDLNTRLCKAPTFVTTAGMGSIYKWWVKHSLPQDNLSGPHSYLDFQPLLIAITITITQLVQQLLLQNMGWWDEYEKWPKRWLLKEVKCVENAIVFNTMHQDHVDIELSACRASGSRC